MSTSSRGGIGASSGRLAAWMTRWRRDLGAAVRAGQDGHEAPPRPADPGRAVQEQTGGFRTLDDVVADCAVYESGRRRPGRVSVAHAAQAARRTDGFVWIGLQQPTTEDVAAIARDFDLPPLAVEDAVKAHQRPKLEIYDDVVFMVLKPVSYVDHEEVVNISEIAVFLGPTFVVTVRHGDSDVLRRVRAELDAGGPEAMSHGPTWVLYRAADLVVDGYEEAIAFINEDVDEIESQVFASADADGPLGAHLQAQAGDRRVPASGAAARGAAGAAGGGPRAAAIDAAASTYFRDVHDHVLRAARRSRVTTGCSPTSCRPTSPGSTRAAERDRRAAERDRRPAEPGHAQDLGLGGHRARTDGRWPGSTG